MWQSGIRAHRLAQSTLTCFNSVGCEVETDRRAGDSSRPGGVSMWVKDFKFVPPPEMEGKGRHHTRKGLIK